MCLSQRADGASWSLVMAATQAVLTMLIFTLAIRRGLGGLGTTDIVVTCIAAGGVVGWLVAAEPVVALAAAAVAALDPALLLNPVYFCLGSRILRWRYRMGAGLGALELTCVAVPARTRTCGRLAR